MFQLENFTGIMCHDTREWCNVLKNDIRKLVKIRANSQKPENLHFDGILLFNAYKVLNEKVRKSSVSWQWRLMQSLKNKLTVGSKNGIRNLVNFNASIGKSHFENWKFSLWCATFIKSKLCLSQKGTDELCIITLKNDAKFEEELTLENDMRDLANFEPTLESLRICTLMGSFGLKFIMFELKKYRGVMRQYTKYNVWAKELYRSFVAWQRRMMQYLKKRWMVVWNMTEGIWLTFADESLKICALMGSFCQ